MEKQPPTLEFFSDYVCPFCWLAEPALLEFARQVPQVKIVRRAFELRPEPVPTLEPRGEYLTRVWRESVYPLAKEMRIEIQLPPVQPRTRLAHEAAHFAAEKGRLEEMHQAIFQAFFQRGEDVGQVEVLSALGEGIGLNGAELAQALTSRRYEHEVLADQERAEMSGVRSVPAYVFGHRRMTTGIRSPEELRVLMG